MFLYTGGFKIDELDKALKIALTGDARDRALTSFRRQVAAWEIALPDTEPLVLDFGLGQFDSVGLIEMWIANEIKAGYCGKYLFVFNGQTCPEHHHLHKHETFFVVEGRVRISCDGEESELEKGGALKMTPGSRHSFTGIGPALLLELSQPCLIEDNYFENEAIPIGGNSLKETKN